MILMIGVAFSIKMAAPKPVVFFHLIFPMIKWHCYEMGLPWITKILHLWRVLDFVEEGQRLGRPQVLTHARVMVAFISEIEKNQI